MCALCLSNRRCLLCACCVHCVQGRRRPFIVVGTVLSTIALVIMSVTTDIQMYSIGFLVLSVANNMIVAPCSALLPDVIPADARGIASGWIGGFSMLGSFGGGLLAYSLDNLGMIGAYVVLIFVHGACAFATVWAVKESPMPSPPPRLTCGARLVSYVAPFRNHDFRVVFGTRFL